MKTTNPDSSAGSKPTNSSIASRLVLAALAALATLPLAARADDAAPTSKTHALLNLEFSDHYLTPRGMDVQNSGLVFQPLILGFFNLYGGDSFVNNVTLVAGVWNCFGTGGIPSSDSGGAKKTAWYEIDPIAGFSVGFAKNFTLDLTYTAFDMQILNIPFSQHLETKLSFNDSPYLKAFALHPYFLYWQELDGKAVASYSSDSSFYLELGVAPSYTVEKIGLKLEAPCRVLFPDSKFYGETGDSARGLTGVAGASTVGLYELGIKATIPLKFMPKGYGNWSFHAGFRYMNFVDKNLQQLANGAGFGSSTRDVTQVYCGISSFF
jgi:hypothetical protein